MTHNSHSISPSPGGAQPERRSSQNGRQGMGVNRAINLLMIDDDETEHFLVNDLLSEITDLDICMTGCVRPEQGVHMIRSGLYDLVLLDQRMNVYTGLDVLKQLSDRIDDTLIVMLTGYRDEETSNQALLLGASHFLYKAEMTSRKLAHIIQYLLTAREHRLNQTERQHIHHLQTVEIATVLKLDHQGVIRYVSMTGLGVMGWDHTQMLGQYIKSYIAATFQDDWDAYFKLCQNVPRRSIMLHIQLNDKVTINTRMTHQLATHGDGHLFTLERVYEELA